MNQRIGIDRQTDIFTNEHTKYMREFKFEQWLHPGTVYEKEIT